MVMSCKAFIDDGDDVGTEPLSVVEAKFDACLQLHGEYCRQLAMLGRRQLGDARQLSATIVLGKWDKFVDRLRKIQEMLTVLQTYQALRHSNIEGE